MKSTIKGLCCLLGVIISLGLAIVGDGGFWTFVGVTLFVISVQCGVKWSERAK